MTGSIAPNRPGHHGTVVARTVGTVAISCSEQAFFIIKDKRKNVLSLNWILHILV